MVKYASYPPPQYSDNPFLALLCKWLNFYGWELCVFNFNIINLIKNAGKVQVCYFHWPQVSWRKGGMLRSFIKCLYFRFNCIVAKTLGYKLVWSAHNALPHEYRSYNLEVWMRKFIVKHFEIIVGHSTNSYTELQKVVQTDFSDKYVLVEHGTYEDFYKSGHRYTKEKLNVPPTKKIVLLKCSKKDYQGSADAIEFLINGQLPEHLVFVLIGSISDEHKARLHKIPQVIVIDGKLNDADFANFFELADIVWMPYRRITTSGFYFMALTFKKPVLATNIDFFKLHSQQGMIYLYDNNNLQETINSLLLNYNTAFDFDKLLDRFSWKNNVRSLIERI
ncbi:hypothetical protein ACFQZI_03300 [Mucilaginibacter lutimaris]|uniref:Glycosyltransferase n=1 Tax=Mucilaginibacter lutimaris TaxID=931629 RepID=A0ABW2ZBB2_9SPHI